MDYFKGKGLNILIDIFIVGFDDYYMLWYMSLGIIMMNYEKMMMGEDMGW